VSSYFLLGKMVTMRGMPRTNGAPRSHSHREPRDASSQAAAVPNVASLLAETQVSQTQSNEVVGCEDDVSMASQTVTVGKCDNVASLASQTVNDAREDTMANTSSAHSIADGILDDALRAVVPVPVEAVEDCCICLEPVAEDHTRAGCGHTFHRCCLERWRDTYQPWPKGFHCPVCRSGLTFDFEIGEPHNSGKVAQDTWASTSSGRLDDERGWPSFSNASAFCT